MISGKSVTGKDYLKTRLYLVDDLRKHLDDKLSVIIEGPRRMGKTSVIKEFERQEEERDGTGGNYTTVYIDLEKITSFPDFYFNLFSRLIEYFVVRNKLQMAGKFLSGMIDGVQGKLEHIKVGDYELKLRENTKSFDFPVWREKLEGLLRNLGALDSTFVIAFDELPDMISNIRQGNDAEAVKEIETTLEWLRALRQEHRKECNYLFVLSGSMNLRNTLEKLGLSSKINDLEPLIVPGMNEKDARTHIIKLSSDNDIDITSDATDYIVNKLIGGSPNLGPGVVRAIKTERLKSVNLDEMTGIYGKMIRSDELSLSHYYERMSKHFSQQEMTISKKVLKRLCSEESISETKLFTEHFNGACEREQFVDAIKRLLEEGYIVRDIKTGGNVRFVSRALKDWWSYKEGVD